jgi:hypothetical protein
MKTVKLTLSAAALGALIAIPVTSALTCTAVVVVTVVVTVVVMAVVTVTTMAIVAMVPMAMAAILAMAMVLLTDMHLMVPRSHLKLPRQHRPLHSKSHFLPVKPNGGDSQESSPFQFVWSNHLNPL